MDVRMEKIEAQLGTTGVLLRISRPNGGPAIGRLQIGKATLKWYPGRTSAKFKSVSMEKFVEWLDSL
jgi:hypothetical protein